MTLTYSMFSHLYRNIKIENDDDRMIALISTYKNCSFDVYMWWSDKEFCVEFFTRGGVKIFFTEKQECKLEARLYDEFYKAFELRDELELICYYS